MENSSIVSYDKLEGLVTWVGTSVASAFFASLERCSCVNLNTSDSDDEENEEEAKDRPLMLTTFHMNMESTHSKASSIESLPV